MSAIDNTLGTGLPLFQSLNFSPTREIKPQVTGSSITSNLTGSNHNMQITSEEREWFSSAFTSCGPVDGFITGNHGQKWFI